MLPQLLDTVRSALMVIVAALFILAFLVQPFRIPSESMERTLLVGDFLLVDKATLRHPPASGDGFCPTAKSRSTTSSSSTSLSTPRSMSSSASSACPAMKSSCGTASPSSTTPRARSPTTSSSAPTGDAYRDQFPRYTTDDPAVDPHWRIQMRGLVENAHLRVPPDTYFVLGDNRNHSRDSRYWGFVPRENIEGTPLLIYFSVREPSATDTAPPAGW